MAKKKDQNLKREHRLQEKEVKLQVTENLGSLVELRIKGVEEQVEEFAANLGERDEIMALFAQDIGALVAKIQAQDELVAALRSDKDVLLNSIGSLTGRIKELENG